MRHSTSVAREPQQKKNSYAAADDRRVIRKCDVVDSRRHVPPRSSVSRRLAGVFTEDDEWRRHLDLMFWILLSELSAAGRDLEPAETGNGEYFYLTRVLKRRAD